MAIGAADLHKELSAIRLDALDHTSSFDYHMLQQEETPSCWSKVKRLFSSQPKAQPDRLFFKVQEELQLPREEQESACFKFLKKSYKVLSWPLDVVHSKAGSLLLSTAAAVGLVASTVLGSHVGEVCSGISLGYFGQTFASHVSEKVQGSDTSSHATRKVVQLVTRLQQHTSLAAMMLTGYYALSPWAQVTNCVLAGMSLRLKLQNQDDIVGIKKLLQAQGIQEIIDDEHAQNMSLSSRVSALFQKHAVSLIAFSGLVAFASGLIAMSQNDELSTPRLLTPSIAFAEYGLKACGISLGVFFERYVNKNEESKEVQVIGSILTKLESVAIGLALYGHGKYKSNLQALFTVLPIGFFLGTSVSKMLVINRAERELLAMSGDLMQAGEGLTCSSVLSHAMMTALFEGVGLYFLLNPSDDTVGYEVFFTFAPAVYYITRFVFSKKQAEKTSFHKVGHFILHKSPQVISEELNYGLSFVFARAVLRSDQNARIYFILQALLFGAIEGALFAIDEQEDKDEYTTLPTKMVSQSYVQKKQLLNKIRKLNTSNYSRMDILMTTFAQIAGRL